MSLEPSRSAYHCYLNEVRRHPLLDAHEELRLCRAVRLGDRDARRRMIEGNLRLVLNIARQYHRSDLPLDDIIEEGNLGLMHAVDKFDPERGFRFSTYAVCWIRQGIERGIMAQSRTVRVPVHAAKRLNQCLKARRELSQVRYGEPSARDLANATGLSVQEVEFLMPWKDRALSLHMNDEENPWLEQLPAADDSPEQHLGKDDLSRALGRWMHRLKPRPREILARRFGLRGEPETLEAIAASLGVTRERVRQIQLEALDQLRFWLREDGLGPGEVLA